MNKLKIKLIFSSFLNQTSHKQKIPIPEFVINCQTS